MSRFIIYIISILLFYTPLLYGQNTFVSKDDAITNVVRYLSENNEEDIDFSELSHQLSLVFDTGINLNNCTDDDLNALHIFSWVQIMNIIDYRKNNNGLATLYELQLIEGISKEEIFLALPFLRIDKREEDVQELSFKALAYRGKHALITRWQRTIETPVGYLPNKDGEIKYLGSPDKLYARYQFQLEPYIQAGITADKDAGEPFFKAPNQQGFDFYSAFLQIKNRKRIKNLIIGDYSLQFGQGITLWNGFGLRKSSSVTNIVKFGKGLSKYSSTDENNFFRGIATTLSYKKWLLSVFVSYKNIDAHINTDSLQWDKNRHNTLYQTGLHITANDFKKKHSITQQLYGANLAYSFRDLKWGITAVRYVFSEQISPSQQLYQYYHFSGNQNWNIGSYYQWNLNRIFLSGELATDQNNHWAYTQNINFNISTKLELALLYRYFDKAYHALYSNAFSEKSGTQNEEGIYSGILFYPHKNWSIKAYLDLYSFPWLRYQISRPSTGVDYLVLATYTLSPQFNFYIQYKSESQLKDYKPDLLHTVQQKEMQNKHLRIHSNYGDLEHFHFKTRVEWSWYQHTGKQQGILMYQDIIYDWKKIPLRTTVRLAIFDIDGYNARIYTYENDLLYNFSIPGFFDRGIRSYLLLKYKLIKNLDIWLKYGINLYADRKTIGSAYQQINGNIRSEIKMQIRWKF